MKKLKKKILFVSVLCLLIFPISITSLITDHSITDHCFAGSLTNYGENAWMNHLFGTSYSQVATIYVALATANPDETATGASMSEVANSGSYARTAITFAAAATRRITQTGAVTFPQATGSWGTVTHWALVDSGTHGAGNVLAYGAFTASFSPVTGNTPSIASGQVYIEITASSGEGFTTYLVHLMLDKIFRNQTYAQPTTCVALLDSTGADTDTTLTTAGKEANWTGYARVLVNKAGGSTPRWEAVSGGATQNENAVTFSTVGTSPTIIVAMAIVDSCTLDAGNVLAYDNDQVVDQTPNVGDTVTFAIGALDVSIQ
jgi:hypothetical protein